MDSFAEGFGKLGDHATRDQLDCRLGGRDNFWKRVHKVFIDPSNEEANTLKFREDKYFETSTVDPSIIGPHTWKKLKDLWKNLNSKYKDCYNRYNKSGTHEPDFYLYCHGRVELYYLWRCQDIKPDLKGTVVEALPEMCWLSSDQISSGEEPASVAVKPERRKKRDVEVIGEILTKFIENKDPTEL